MADSAAAQGVAKEGLGAGSISPLDFSEKECVWNPTKTPFSAAGTCQPRPKRHAAASGVVSPPV